MYGVMAPQHLHRLGLLTDNQLYTTNTNEKLINRDDNESPNTGEADFNLKVKNKIQFERNTEPKDIYTGKKSIANDDQKQSNSKEIELNSKLKQFEFDNNVDSNVFDSTLKQSYRKLFDDHRFKSLPRSSFRNKMKEAFIMTGDYSNSRRFDRYNNLFRSNRDLKFKKGKSFQNVNMNFQSKLNTYYKIQGTNFPNADIKMKLRTDEILLMKQALNKIPQIPFSLLIDEYRWKYFEGRL